MDKRRSNQDTEVADMEIKQSIEGKRDSRIDTEHRGVTGTLILTDVVDEKAQFRLPSN
jgi:hypothetical protein